MLGTPLINFSFGGAEALGTQTLEEAAGPAIPDQVKAEITALPPDEQAPTTIDAALNKNINLSGQMADLVAETSAHPPSAHSALVSLIGLNDLQALVGTFDPSNPLALIGEVAQVVAGIVQADLGAAHTAFNQGISTVIFETLPSPSFFPIDSELPPELQAIGDVAVDAVNLGLRVDAAELRLEGHDARIVDLAKITGEISADPTAFGFQNLDQPTLLGNGIEFSVNPAAPPPDQTAFFDPLHPTTKLHAVLAQFAAASLTSHADFGGGGNHFHHRQPWRQPRLRRRPSGSVGGIASLWAEVCLTIASGLPSSEAMPASDPKPHWRNEASGCEVEPALASPSVK